MFSMASQYEQEYSVLSADITAKIGRIPNLFGKEKHDLVRVKIFSIFVPTQVDKNAH